MNITTNVIRDFLNSYSSHITYIAVAHTNFHTFNCNDKEIAQMVLQAKKQCRYFRNCFNQFLYQAKAHRKPNLYQPLMLTTIEGTKDVAKRANTIHFHFALGNIPACLSTEELKQIFEHCWVDKAKVGSREIWLEPARQNEEGAWLNYITKELTRGDIDAWDFENSQIPHAALQLK
jgi:hypothetical protein